MPSGLPALKRGRINAQLLGHFLLRQAERPACGGETFRKRVGRRQRVVTQELNNSRYETDLGDACVAFPTGNRHFVNANLVGYLLLEELQVEAARADVVT